VHLRKSNEILHNRSSRWLWLSKFLFGFLLLLLLFSLLFLPLLSVNITARQRLGEMSVNSRMIFSSGVCVRKECLIKAIYGYAW
jgi:hypothetical protein